MRRRFIAALVSAATVWLFGGGHSWHDRVDALQRFVGQRFALVWHDEGARDELARSAARDLGLGLRLHDADGSELAAYGPDCRRPHTIEVVEGETVLGRIEACAPGFGGGGPAPMIGTFFVGAFVLWLSSGYIAYRLTRPLANVVKVTREIGIHHSAAAVWTQTVTGRWMDLVSERKLWRQDWWPLQASA